MRNVWIARAFLLAALPGLSPNARAQGARDLSGVWNRLSSKASNSDNFTYEEPSMTPWA